MPRKSQVQKVSFLEGYKPNFETLLRAGQHTHLALLEARDRKTKKLVPLVCAVYEENGENVMVPLARMLDGDPYKQFDPPKPGGGF